MHCRNRKNNQLVYRVLLALGGQVNTLPVLVPVLKLVELRTKVFGSEQKSLRAWQGSKRE